MDITDDEVQYETLNYIKSYLGVNANIVCRLVACKAVRVKAHPAAYPKYCVDDIRTYLQEQGRGRTPRKSVADQATKAAIPIEPARRSTTASTTK